MRKINVGILTLLLLLLFTTNGSSQKKVASSKKTVALKTMTWTTKSKAAHDLAGQGASHLMNAEFEMAYRDFSEAVKLDPNFTVALVFMSNLSAGNSRKMYAKRALKSAADKTAGEKLFASIVDEKNTQEARQDIWAKLHKMFPDGGMIGHFYAISRATPEERFAAAQDYIKRFPDNPGMYNTIGYYYLQDKKDTAMAKQYLEKYLAMYPEGANPYDSMGELYLDMGDYANAEKYYTMALEKYPFTNSSINALEKMRAEKKIK
jgi:tetratricopeptide (TPR) repeat protein